MDKKVLIVVPGIAAAVTLAGCAGTQAAPGSPATSTSAHPGTSAPGNPAQPVKADLTITVRASETSKATTWTLRCAPTGGTHPNAAQACAALAMIKGDPFAPTPKGRMCTDIYGGPEVATVTGTWNGQKVNTSFGRKDGCQIARWTKIAPLLGPIPSTH